MGRPSLSAAVGVHAALPVSLRATRKLLGSVPRGLDRTWEIEPQSAPVRRDGRLPADHADRVRVARADTPLTCALPARSAQGAERRPRCTERFRGARCGSVPRCRAKPRRLRALERLLTRLDGLSRGFRSRDRFHQLHGLDTKCVSKLHDIEQADIAFAALDSPNIISVQVRQFCETLLRKSALHPQFTDAFAEQYARVWSSHLTS